MGKAGEVRWLVGLIAAVLAVVVGALVMRGWRNSDDARPEPPGTVIAANPTPRPTPTPRGPITPVVDPAPLGEPFVVGTLPGGLIVVADPDTTSVLAAVLASDAETTTVLGRDYLIGADGRLVELTAEQVAARRSAQGARDGSTANATDAASGATDEEAEPEEPKGDGTISGRVQRGSNPVAEATLAYVSDTGDSGSATTGSDGAYSFSGLAYGSYRVMLQEPSSPDNVRSAVLNADSPSERIDFQIPDFPPAEGRVVGPEGEGVAEARLEVLAAGALRGSVVANNEGYFQLFPLEPGAYELSATATGYRPGQLPFVIPEETAPAEIEVRLEAAATIEGQVVGPLGPVSGAWVALFSGVGDGDPLARYGTLSSDGSGRFRFSIPDQLPTGSFRVGAHKSGLVPGYSDSLTAESTLKGIAVYLSDGATVSGRIIDADEAPVEGAEITLSSGFQSTGAIRQRFNTPYPSTQSGPDGTFRLPAIEPGATTMIFSAEGFVPQEKVLTLQAGSNAIGDITLESSDDTKKGRIHGIVVDERGSGLSQHNVYVRHADGTGFNTKTDSRGGFRLDDLPEGVYTLFTNGSMLRGDLFVTMDQVVLDVQPGGSSLVVLYDFAQAATVKVTNVAGEPLRTFKVRASVSRYGPNGSLGYQEKRTADFERIFQTTDGSARIGTLLSGTASFTISVDGVGVHEIPSVVIGTGQTVDLGTIKIGKGTTVSGTTLDDTGAPVSGATIRISRPSGSTAAPLSLAATSDASGRWSIAGVPEGDLTVTATRSGHVRAVVTPYTASGGALDLTLARAATVVGWVTNPEGVALSGIEVQIGDVNVYTNSEGRFYADTIAPGPVGVTVRDPNGVYTVDPVTIEGTAGNTTTVRLNLTKR